MVTLKKTALSLLTKGKSPRPTSAYLEFYRPHPSVQDLGFHSLSFVLLLITQSTMKFFEGPLRSPGPTEKPNPPRREPKSK